MAEETFNINLNVNGGEGAKSLADYKKEFEELQGELSKAKEGTKEYDAVLKKLGANKDAVGLLRDKIAILGNDAGKITAIADVGGKLASGFAAATGAAALFGNKSEAVEKSLLKVQAALALSQGIKDVGNLGDSFKVLGTILKANPLFLIASIITGIGVALFALKDKIGFIGDAFEALGKVISYIGDKITEFLDFIGLTNSALDELGETAVKNAEATTKALEQQTAAYDDQIKVAKAAGKSTVELEKAKQEAIIATNKAIVEQIIAFVRAGGELDDEKKKILSKSLDDIRKAKVEEQVIEITDQKDKADKYKKFLEEKKKKEDDNREQSSKAFADSLKDEQDATKLHFDDLTNQISENYVKQNELQDKNQEELRAKKEEQDKKDIEDEKKKQELIEAGKREIVERSLAASKVLSDLYFQFQLNKAKGNAAQELEIRKKQFQVEKAFNVARAIIDGIRSVQAANTIPPPVGTALAISNGILAAANVAKILATKFDSGGGGGGGDTGGAVGSVGGGSIPSAPPTIQTPQNTNTLFDEKGNNLSLKQTPIVKAVVVETDITDTQNKVSKLQDQAVF